MELTSERRGLLCIKPRTKKWYKSDVNLMQILYAFRGSLFHFNPLRRKAPKPTDRNGRMELEIVESNDSHNNLDIPKLFKSYIFLKPAREDNMEKHT